MRYSRARRRISQCRLRLGGNMVRKIALEEHFLSPGLVDYWRPTMTEVAAGAR